MNIELKHLVPYLPYALKCMYADGLVFEIDGLVHLFNEIHANSKNSAYPLYTFKPILRPLSDLTKEIEVNGERFVSIEKLQSVFSKRLRFDEDGFYNHDEISMVNRGGDKIFTFNQLDAYSFLFKWHFDVFGLISEGLAIDINTIDQCK